MKLLVIVDGEEYSRRAAEVAARFAVNTWADVTILGLQASGDRPEPRLVGVLEGIHRLFLGTDSPYGTELLTATRSIGDGTWEMTRDDDGRKLLRVIIRHGEDSRVALNQAREDDVDFLIIGSARGNDPQWGGDIRLPQRVVTNASCSSLVVKAGGATTTLACCLDQTRVSQESLEIVNQLVTIHRAELKILGLSRTKERDEKIHATIMEVLRYYAERGIRAWLRLVEPDELPGYARELSRTGMLGLWFGKQSFLRKIFSPNHLEKILEVAESSVLILK